MVRLGFSFTLRLIQKNSLFPFFSLLHGEEKKSYKRAKEDFKLSTFQPSRSFDEQKDQQQQQQQKFTEHPTILTLCDRFFLSAIFRFCHFKLLVECWLSSTYTTNYQCDFAHHMISCRLSIKMSEF